MKQKRYTNEQIVYALKQAEGGRKINELCRQTGVCQETTHFAVAECR